MSTEAEQQVILDQLKQLGLDTLTYAQLVCVHRRNLAEQQRLAMYAHLHKTMAEEQISVEVYLERYPSEGNFNEQMYGDSELFVYKLDTDAQSMEEIRDEAMRQEKEIQGRLKFWDPGVIR